MSNQVLSRHDDRIVDWLVRPFPEGVSDRVRFDHSRDEWYVWNSETEVDEELGIIVEKKKGVLWEPDRKDRVYELIRQVGERWIANADAETTKELLPILGRSKKESVLKSLASRPSIAVAGDEWDIDPTLMGFRNGVLNLKTLEFDEEPDPGLMISKSTGHDWDPDADASSFVAFLVELMGGNERMAEYLIRVLGYAMYGFQREQKFWVWTGEGQNGKGTLSRLMEYALGRYAAHPSSELYMRTRFGAARADAPRPELIKLQGIRFAWMSEPDGGKFNDELLKAHSGDDPITARDLYGKAKSIMEWRPTHTIVFLANQIPSTEDVGVSMQRRVRIVKFQEEFTGAREDKGLEDRLRKDISGMIRAIAEAARQYYLIGDIPEPPEIAEWSQEYIESNDPLSPFLNEVCEIDKTIKTAQSILYGEYREWTTKHDLETWSQRDFGAALGRRFRKVKVRGYPYYYGVKLKSVMELEDEEE